MFSKFSLKTKLIIFSIAAVIGIGIIAYNGINNFKLAQLKITESSLKAGNSNETLKGSSTNADQSNKQKQLEQKYQEALTHFHSKEYSTAINICDDIIKADNNFYKAYSIKGIALCYSNKYIDGMKNIDKALELKSDYGYGLFNKALALELYGKYDEALNWYDKALAVENNYIWSYYGKARIYGIKRDVPNTIKNLKSAIDMNNSVKEMAKDEPNFNNVRQSKEFQQLIQ